MVLSSYRRKPLAAAAGLLIVVGIYLHSIGLYELGQEETKASFLQHRRLRSRFGWGDPKTILQKGYHASDTSIPVFYNVFTKSEEDIPRVISIVTEQLSHLLPVHHVFLRSIGQPIASEVAKINTISAPIELIQHDAEGDEVSTLSHLWQYCKNNPTGTVVYIHSKGSFHPSRKNENLRRFLTRGALSEECANAPIDSCNVCSSRMSPIPHPHTPGNMWLARCDYIKNLPDPLSFELQMGRVPFEENGRRGRVGESCNGRSRFAAEHWVHSHPSARPCDLYRDPTYTHGYDLGKQDTFEMDLKTAPRSDLVYNYNPRSGCLDWGWKLEDRLLEYEFLYQERPADDWWGWKFFESHTPQIRVQ